VFDHQEDRYYLEQHTVMRSPDRDICIMRLYLVRSDEATYTIVALVMARIIAMGHRPRREPGVIIP